MYLIVAFVMIAVSGIDAKWVVSLALLAVACIAIVFSSDILEDYQQARLTVFLFDSEEVTEAAAAYAYNAEQAQIAIGNGGLLGQGLFRGTQTRSQLVPAQQTDFIFTVVGEELGLRGAGILLGLYALMLLRIWRTAVLASSAFGRLVCAGVFTMFAFQMFQAVGMTMGMMPVTGIPMPLVSYGGIVDGDIHAGSGFGSRCLPQALAHERAKLLLKAAHVEKRRGMEVTVKAETLAPIRRAALPRCPVHGSNSAVNRPSSAYSSPARAWLTMS